MKQFKSLLFVVGALVFSTATHAQPNPYFKVVPTDGGRSVRIVPAQAEHSACVHATLTGITGATLSTAFEHPISTLPTYLVMCYGTGVGRVCSTGTTGGDMKLYGRDNSAGVKATTFTNPLPPGTPVDGITWVAPPHVTARFSFINFLDQAIVQGNTNNNSLKIGSQVFAPSSNCRSVATDPYGVVFDNTSLEPVAGAEVRLLRQRDKGEFTLYDKSEKVSGNLINPQAVGADGLFNFVVDPGTYKLEISNLPVVSDTTKHNPKASRVYTDLYHGESFIEDGVIKHFNIPVTANPATIAAQQSKLVTYSYTIDRPTSSILFEGRASHPLTTVESYTYLTSNTTPNPLPVREVSIDTQQADTGGVFTIKLPLASIPTSESFGLLKLTKKNIADLASSGRKTGLTTVSAEDVSYITLNPIPEKIEGYLTDKSGTPLKNMRVDILLPYADTPYLSTTTDSTGFLQIPGSYLPSEPFTLKSPDTQTTWTTSEFLAGNTGFYEVEGKELVKPLSIITEAANSTTGGVMEKQTNKTQITPPTTTQNMLNTTTQAVEQGKRMVLTRYLIFILALMVLLVLFVFVYLRQKTTGEHP
ncbi:MAG: hypothetical protein WCJ70_04135 [bacterium]